MSLFALISLTVAIACALLALFTLLQARNQLHHIWGIFNFNVALWCLGLYLIGVAQSSSQAFFYWKLTTFINTFIAVFFYHLIYLFCQIREKRLLILIYLQAFLFSFAILFFKPFFSEINLIFNEIYLAKATPFFSLWLFTFSVITIIAFYRVWQFVKTSNGERKTQALYLFWGMLVGFGGGFTIALPMYGVSIYPGWHFLICIYAGIFTFSILRHHFLDIRVGLMRLLIPVCILMMVLFFFCFFYFDMTLFSLASLSVAILCTLLAFIVFAYSTKKVHQIWAIFNLFVAAWGLAIFFAGMSTLPDKALIFWRLTYLPCTFIAVVYYHVIAEFCGIKRPRMLAFAYIQGALFVPFIIFSDYFVGSTFYVFNSIHYHKATVLFAFWLMLWVIIVASAFVELHKFIKRSQGIQKTQALYLFWGMLLGHTGGAISVIPSFNILIYPAWHFMICIYAAISTYAIFRYHIMDIKIAGARLGIFVLVYSLVLGIPFGLQIFGVEWLATHLGHKWAEWTPMLTLLAFATAGPFIYLYLQRKAEENILQEEQRIQDLLMQVSYGMNTIHKIQQLLDLIVTIVVKTLKVDGARIFLLNREADKFELKAPKDNNGAVFSHDDPMVDHLRQKQYPIIYDEIKALSEMNGTAKLKDVEARMCELQAQLIVPITLNNSLSGFLALGARQSKDMYTKGLLNALSVLGNHAATAIDRCIYLEAETKRLEEEGLKERILSLDHMASSMAHEIDNPMHSVNVTAGFIRDLLKDARVRYLPAEVLNEFHAALDRIKVSGERVSGIVKAILDYSKMGQGKGEFKPVNIKEAVEGFSYLIEGEKKKEMVRLDIQTEDELPPILGDRIQLEEIFVNFVRNAIHAVKHKPKEERRVILKIFKKDYKTIRIECIDNGYGIEKNLLKDIFLANVTTKGSSEGTGLGLHRVRKIVDAFGGRVWAESEGKDKGATLIVELPSYDGDKIAGMDILNPDKEKKEDKKGKKKDNEKNEKDRKDEG